MEYIAVVNDLDQIVGYEEKLDVHKNGTLHRAFSVIIYDDNGNMLIQQRSSKKYHSPSLWTNACCSHQRHDDKTIADAARRRIFEELGIIDIELKQVDKIRYKCLFENGLIENEMDYIFVGNYNGNIAYDKEEIDDIKWVDKNRLLQWLDCRSEEFTYWFKILAKKFINLMY